ncbi:hypothetical protein KIN20_002420 [Parelaphostrongylus tenuis]|uniref:Uncharacterized protein n=1 Tax=Parelaphostrongylus tenuis TaxID=148309 RepID=A0AAD5QDI9_PARTN|nr:hypothetical protein KIN20_002420 [Parelaphostrongylus tenuis]
MPNPGQCAATAAHIACCRERPHVDQTRTSSNECHLVSVQNTIWWINGATCYLDASDGVK